MYNKHYHIFFVGIGGIGMSGIAEILCDQGYRVSGSDLSLSPVTSHLAEKGIAIYEGHRKENIRDAHVLVCTSAVDETNPEIQARPGRTLCRSVRKNRKPDPEGHGSGSLVNGQRGGEVRTH